MKPVIKVEGIGKSFTINHKDRANYGTIKDDFTNLIRNPFSKRESSEEKFWALKDVSFEVNQGEIFGIVGRNGSGKSTLLKVLSRIITPDTGKVTLHGKTASLLEVGTGFHPELTGRENIYFNGSMLGMKRSEINAKFNKIVEFSEVEKFIDTPVKFYSSGMYVRLAFSVAAHLEPDILILDEVLSVGDAAFQKKSLSKILETMHEGRTVLFVSHSMATVQQLCTRGVLLQNGTATNVGPIGEIADTYNNLINKGSGNTNVDRTWSDDNSQENEYISAKKIYITDDAGNVIDDSVRNDQQNFLNIELDILKESSLYTIGYMVKNEARNLVYMAFESDQDPKNRRKKIPKGRVHLKTPLPKNLLNEGDYKISLLAGVYNQFWIFDPETNTPSVNYTISGGLSLSPYWTNMRSGMLAIRTDWEII